MSYVKIYKLQNDGTQKTLVTCRLQDKRVVCDGDPVFVENLEKRGIPDADSPQSKRLFLADGLKFLEHLSRTYTSGYLMASAVLNDTSEASS